MTVCRFCVEFFAGKLFLDNMKDDITMMAFTDETYAVSLIIITKHI
jgi:hypothetical protein